MIDPNASTNTSSAISEASTSKAQPAGTPAETATDWPSPALAEVLGVLDQPRQRPYRWADAADSVGGGLLRTDGRSARSEYWMGSVILATIWVPITIALLILTKSASLVLLGASLLGLLVWLPFVTLVEALRAVRRLHDCGNSGVWVLLAVVPFGLVALAWLLTRPGQPGPNRYGPMSQPGWDRSSALAC